MKFKNWKEGLIEEKDVTYFKLEEAERHDYITLAVVDVAGEVIKNGYLAHIDVDFKVMVLLGNITDSVPLKTDLVGCLITATESEIKLIHRDKMMESLGKAFADKYQAEQPEEIKH